MKTIKLALLVLFLSLPSFALTTVTGTLHKADGSNYSGSFHIYWSTFMNASGVTIQGGNLKVTLSSGSFSVALEPTTTSTPVTSYRIEFDQLQGAQLATEYWNVGTSSPTTQAAVRTISPTSPTSVLTNLITGAINLTTTGSIPYVSSTGQLSQDSSNLFYDSSSHRLCIGCNSFDDIYQKLKISSPSHASPSINAGTGNYYAVLGLVSGGGGGAEDSAGLAIKKASTDLWRIAGVWNGSPDFGVRNALDSFDYNLLIESATGDSYFKTTSTNPGGQAVTRLTSNDSRGGIQFLNSSLVSKAEFTEDPTHAWRLTTSENLALNFGVNSVTAGGFASGDSTEPISELGNFNIRPGYSVYRFGFGYDTTDNYAWMQSTKNGIDYSLLHISPMGGNVVMGGCISLSDCTNKDSGYRFDIQSSGVNGTMRLFDPNGTSLQIRLGSAQLGSGAAPFEVRRNDGTSQLAGIDNAGAFYSSDGTKRITVMGVTGFSQAANMISTWSNTSNDVDQTRDTGIGRNAAGIVEINTGALGSLGKLKALGGITTATSAYDSDLSNSTCSLPILTTNTNLQLRCKGSDGTVRKIDLTVAP